MTYIDFSVHLSISGLTQKVTDFEENLQGDKRNNKRNSPLDLGSICCYMIYYEKKIEASLFH